MEHAFKRKKIIIREKSDIEREYSDCCSLFLLKNDKKTLLTTIKLYILQVEFFVLTRFQNKHSVFSISHDTTLLLKTEWYKEEAWRIYEVFTSASLVYYSWCFLWTTQKYLWDSKSILQGWGFNHKLTMVWEKTYGKSAGMPLYGFRWNAEFILVGTRGKKEMFPKRKLIPAVFQAASSGARGCRVES